MSHLTIQLNITLQISPLECPLLTSHLGVPFKFFINSIQIAAHLGTPAKFQSISEKNNSILYQEMNHFHFSNIIDSCDLILCKRDPSCFTKKLHLWIIKNLNAVRGYMEHLLRFNTIQYPGIWNEAPLGGSIWFFMENTTGISDHSCASPTLKGILEHRKNRK